MISLDAFLNAIFANVKRIKQYTLGHDGSDGKCDCIGLIIGAIKLSGLKWTGIHGSNWTARNAIANLKYISSPHDFYDGEIVFKAKNSNEAGYNLPDSYKNSSDKKDYYHVGVVTSTNPLCITHCTGVDGGIKKDTTQGNWRYGGSLIYVNYETGEVKMEEPLYRAIVTATIGKTVNMRSKPSVASKVLYQIPIGTNIEVMDVLDSWGLVRYKNQDGYIMSRYLIEENIKQNTSTISDVELIQIRDTLQNILDRINKAINK